MSKIRGAIILTVVFGLMFVSVGFSAMIFWNTAPAMEVLDNHYKFSDGEFLSLVVFGHIAVLYVIYKWNKFLFKVIGLLD